MIALCPVLKKRVIQGLKILKVCRFVCLSQSKMSLFTLDGKKGDIKKMRLFACLLAYETVENGILYVAN
jgi:hypothetical protein